MEIGVEGDGIEVVGNVMQGLKMADTTFGNLGLAEFDAKVDGGIGVWWGMRSRNPIERETETDGLKWRLVSEREQ